MTMLLNLAVRPDCVVFSGDKRLSDANGVSDIYAKATRLGNNGVGGVCGATRRVEKETGTVQIDVHEQLRAFFADRNVGLASIDELLPYLRQEHDAYVDTYRNGVQYEKLHRLYTVWISSLQDDKIVEYLIKCVSRPGDGFVYEQQTRLCKSSALMAAGDDAVQTALYQFDHPAFNELRKAADIAGVLTPPNGLPFGSITLDRAVEVCRLVNRTCSEKAEQITGKLSTISPDCDVLILDKDGVRAG